MSLVPVDATSEVAVTSYLSQARDWLARAVDETGPEQIAAAWPPLTDEQVEEIAKILATVEVEQVAA